LSRENIAKDVEIFIITLDIVGIIYLEKEFARYWTQMLKKRVEKEFLQESKAIVVKSSEMITNDSGLNLKVLGEKIRDQQERISSTIDRIAIFSTNMLNAKMAMDCIVQKVMKEEGSSKNQLFSDFKNPLGVDRNFRRAVRSSGDSSQFESNFQKYIHEDSMKFNLQQLIVLADLQNLSTMTLVSQ
jgi:hypothetical protein